MKPRALLQSCDKHFSKEFISFSSELLDVQKSDLALQYSYHYIFASNNKKFIKKILPKIKRGVKTVLVCTYDCRDYVKSFPQLHNIKVLYYGQLISSSKEKSSINNLLATAAKDKINAPLSNIYLNAVTAKELISAMHESTFTYYSGKPEEFVVSNDLSFHSFVSLLKQRNPNLNIRFSNATPKISYLPRERVTLSTDITYLLNIYNSYLPKGPNKKFKFPKIVFKLTPPQFSLDKLIKYSSFVFSLPVVILIVSGVSLYIGFLSIGSNPSLASLGFKIAKNTSFFNSFRESAGLGEKVLAVTDSTDFDFDNATPDQLRDYLYKLQLTVNSLYKDMSFKKDDYLFSDLIGQSRDTILRTHDFLEMAPILLGLNKQISYALVFQKNNLATGVMYLEVKDGKVLYKEYYTSDDIDNHIPGLIQAPYDQDDQWKFRDVAWYGDLNLVSGSVRWFLDKSLNLSPDTTIFLPNDNLQFLNEKLVSDSSLLDMQLLQKLLDLSNLNQVTANSNNIQLQAFIDNQNISSSISSGGNQVLLDEFSEQGISDSVKRVLSTEIKYSENDVTLFYTIKYKNLSGSDYSFWPKLHLTESITVDETTFLKGSEEIMVFPEISKNKNLKTIESEITLEDKEEIIIKYKLIIKNNFQNELTPLKFFKTFAIPPVALKVFLYSKPDIVLGTTPTMNLISQGELSYTTVLGVPLELEIKTNH